MGVLFHISFWLCIGYNVRRCFIGRNVCAVLLLQMLLLVLCILYICFLVLLILQLLFPHTLSSPNHQTNSPSHPSPGSDISLSTFAADDLNIGSRNKDPKKVAWPKAKRSSFGKQKMDRTAVLSVNMRPLSLGFLCRIFWWRTSSLWWSY